jgi:ribose/xylose/arabinose/galactoside ABC-type transport system permease subunit
MGEKNGAGTVGSILRSTEFGLFVSIALLMALIYALDPVPKSFFTRTTQLSLLHQISLYGILAVGASVVIISGGIDLSVGAVAALSSIVCGKLITQWLWHSSPDSSEPSVAVILLAEALTLAMGLGIGLFHALLINHFGLPPFIATLATMSGLRSLASIIAENRVVNVPYYWFRLLGHEEWATFATFAVVATLASVMMGLTVRGRHLFALGGNEAAARLSGLKIHRLKAFSYGLSGFLAALAGILFAGRSGQGSPSLGLSYELFAITAAVVGGCSLAGGVGSVRGTVLGLILLQTLIRGTGLVVRKIDLSLFGKRIIVELNSTQVEGLVLGTVIILAVAINQKGFGIVFKQLRRFLRFLRILPA